MFLFCIVLTEKDNSVKAIKNDFYGKVIEAKCTKAIAWRCIKGVLRNFAKFTRKHMCQSPFFNKVVG